MREKIIAFINFLLLELSANAYFATGDRLHETLEKLTVGSKTISYTLKSIQTGIYGIEVDRVINQVNFSPILNSRDPSCQDREIQIMDNFHEFMIENSENYRRHETEFPVIRLLINDQLKYSIDCLGKLKKSRIDEKLKEVKWQLLARKLKPFWEIVSRNTDIYYLGIVSHLKANRRKIRDANDSPQDWGRMIKCLLLDEMHQDRSETTEPKSIQTTLIAETEEDLLTGLRYPKQDFMANIYDHFISNVCRTLQSDGELVELLRQTTLLAGLAMWPENPRDQRLYPNMFDESTLGFLALGHLVCEQLSKNERFKIRAVEKEDTIIRVLTQDFKDNLSDHHKNLLVCGIQVLEEICKLPETLDKILSKAYLLFRIRGFGEVSRIQDQMSKLEAIVVREPHAFYCDDDEIDKIGDLSRSLDRFFKRAGRSIQYLDVLLKRLRIQFTEECLKREVENILRLVDWETELAADNMPRFWNFIELENRGANFERASIRLWLAYAKKVFDGSKKLPDLSKHFRYWHEMMEESLKDLLESTSGNTVSSMNKYSIPISDATLSTDLPTQIQASEAYRKLIVEWCKVFYRHMTADSQKLVDEIEKTLRIANVFMGMGDEFELLRSIDSGGKFLLAKLTLGYSVCLNLDLTTRLERKFNFGKRKWRGKRKLDGITDERLLSIFRRYT